MAAGLLSRNNNRSYCREVRPEVLCILGKQHTPSKGVTFRSLTHLALSYSGEIEARWILASPTTVKTPAARRDTLNLLLLPWPEHIETADFKTVPPLAKRADGSDPPGYFRYDPEPRENDAPDVFAQRLRSALKLAREHAGPIDAVVLPELALNYVQCQEAEQIVFDEGLILICGMRQARKAEGQWDANVCVLQAAGAVREAPSDPDRDAKLREDLGGYQAKHHRWHLDRPQIVTYQLGGALPVERGVWEHIELEGPRVLHFMTVKELTWSALICEDLARQDPAAELGGPWAPIC